MYVISISKLKSRRLDKIRWLYQQGIINESVWLAGGALRTLVDPKETIVDYDLFFKYDVREHQSMDAFWHKHLTNVTETREALTKLGFKLTFECPEGKMYTYEKSICSVCGTVEIDAGYQHTLHIFCKQKVQLICEYFYSSPEELLATFDLTPTLFCTDGTRLWCYKSGVNAVKNKQCDLHKLIYPFSTFRRIMKYSNKGYNCQTAINKFISNLIDRTSILTEDEMRIYID